MPSKFMQIEKHDRTALYSLEAQIAVSLVERWGLVAGDLDNGEDSAGRSRLRLQTPTELVTRATETAALLVTTLQANDWIKPTPPEKPWRATTTITETPDKPQEPPAP